MTKTILESVYFAVYVLLALSGVLFSAGGSQRTKRIYVAAAFIFLALFTGLRWETGTDWEAYKQLFDDTTSKTVFHTYHFDTGYVIFNYLVKIISSDYTVFLLINSFIAVFLIYHAVSGTNAAAAVSILIFYTNYFIAHYMGSNRRIIAMGLGLNAILLIYENRKKKALALIVLAFLFHRSALVLFLAYLIPRKKTDACKVFVLLGICGAIGCSGILPGLLKILFSTAFDVTHLYLFNSALFHVTNAQAETIGFTHFIFACLKRAVIFTAMYFFYWQSGKKDKLYTYLLNTYVLAISVYLLTAELGTFSILTAYFTIVEVIIWGLMYRMSKRENKMFVLGLAAAVSFVQLLNDFPMYAEVYFPYQIFWMRCK